MWYSLEVDRPRGRGDGGRGRGQDACTVGDDSTAWLHARGDARIRYMQIIVVVGVTLNVSNVIGYHKCSKEAGKKASVKKSRGIKRQWVVLMIPPTHLPLRPMAWHGA